MTAEISEAVRRDMIARREEHKALFESKIDEAKAEHTAEFERSMNRLRGHSKEKGFTPEDDQGEGMSEITLEVMMDAERRWDEGGYKTVPTIIAEAVIEERARWIEAATELADLMDDVVSGNYVPDSFTTQPIRALIRGEA